MPHFMHQGIQGKEVTFKDVLILFLKRFERILAVALAFAVVFAAFGGLRAYRSVSAENTQKLQDDYQLKLDEYNQSTEKLRITIEQQQQRLDSMQRTASTTIWMLSTRQSASWCFMWIPATRLSPANTTRRRTKPERLSAPIVMPTAAHSCTTGFAIFWAMRWISSTSTSC